jgi:hypothetical protein
MEEWRDIPGFEGYYQVSNMGRVKSMPRERRNHHANWISKERILRTPKSKSDGYNRCVLCVDGKEYPKRVFVLVAMAFLEYNSGEGLEPDHIISISDGGTDVLSNLKLITHRENCSKDRKNKTSKYTGVSWHKKSGKWVANIYINKKLIYLGCFNTEEEASEAYIKRLTTLQ